MFRFAPFVFDFNLPIASMPSSSVKAKSLSIELDSEDWMYGSRSLQEEEGCLFNKLSNLEENQSAICLALKIPSTLGAQDFLI